MGTELGIAENYYKIRERIARAAERSGRRGEEIRLVAVSKTQPPEAVREALAAGVREFGENYVQEAEGKLAALGTVTAVRHFIGHLQKNKAGKAAALFDVVQSVDNAELARALGRRSAALGHPLDVLIEVNISQEESKFGARPERTLELAHEIREIPGIRLQGLMGIGPLSIPDGNDRERATRESFRHLKQLFDELPEECRRVLSMGMTGDFELAIEQGSTMVRIGTGIFGARRSS